jgi:hypothetical protein
MPDLHLEILRQPQRRLWELLQADAPLIHSGGFVLAGGTALALQIGHRESHDFDFFSRSPGVEPIRTWFERLPGAILRDADRDTAHGEVSGVKLSFIAGYRYPFIAPLVAARDLELAHVTDIALMKMLAITHRATLRDYIDLAAILRNHCTLASLIEQAGQKYGSAFNPMLTLRTMVHFGDLDDDMPVVLDHSLSSAWQDILRNAVRGVA